MDARDNPTIAKTTRWELTTFDGLRLRGLTAEPLNCTPEGTVLLLHGRTEFIEKYEEVICELVERGYAVHTFDWRGQGLSSREMDDSHKGWVGDFEDYLADLSLVLDDIVQIKTNGPPLAIAHSMGGHLALRLLCDRPDAFSGALLTAPMVDIRVPLLRPLLPSMVRALCALGWGGRYAPGTGNYREGGPAFERNGLTSDPTRFQKTHACIVAEPGLALGGPTLAWLNAAFHSIDHLRDCGGLHKIRIPIHMLLGGRDRVVGNRRARSLAACIPTAHVDEIAGAHHEVLFEKDALRDEFWRVFDAFSAT